MDVQAGLIVARALHFAALLALFGTALFPLYSAPAISNLAGPDRRRDRVARISVVLALVSGAGWLVFTTAAMAGDLAAGFDTAGLGMVLSATPFGQVWSWRLGLTALLAAGLLAFRLPPALTAAASAALLGSLALTGHAAVTEGALGDLHRASDALHLLAAGGWLGALLSLAHLLKRERFGEAAARALLRFSGVGSLFAVVLVATGFVNGWLTMGGPAPLLEGLYGRLLLIKVALVTGMIALAALNRFRLAPAFAADPDDKGRRLRLTVAAEQVLALCVVGLAAAIGTLDPAD